MIISDKEQRGEGVAYIMEVRVANSDQIYYLADLFLTLSKNLYDAVIFQSKDSLDLQIGRVENYLENDEGNITAQCKAVECSIFKAFFP